MPTSSSDSHALITQEGSGKGQRPPRETVTRLLLQARGGNREAFDDLFPLVYEELRGLARLRARWSAGETLNTTALVHEAYLKLVDQSRADWKSHGHFSAVAAKAMRHILIDYARRTRAAKRGGGQPAVSLDQIEGTEGSPDWSMEEMTELLILNEALDELARLSERQSRIVEMKFFAGMSNEEIATALGVSVKTVKRGWSLAQAWLYRRLKEVPSGEASPVADTAEH